MADWPSFLINQLDAFLNRVQDALIQPPILFRLFVKLDLVKRRWNLLSHVSHSSAPWSVNRVPYLLETTMASTSLYVDITGRYKIITVILIFVVPFLSHTFFSINCEGFLLFRKTMIQIAVDIIPELPYAIFRNSEWWGEFIIKFTYLPDLSSKPAILKSGISMI